MAGLKDSTANVAPVIQTESQAPFTVWFLYILENIWKYCGEKARLADNYQHHFFYSTCKKVRNRIH